MEAMLGTEIRTLSYELLSHKLTPEQEQERIDRASLAIERVSRQQAGAAGRGSHQLIAHGDFIQNKGTGRQGTGAVHPRRGSARLRRIFSSVSFRDAFACGR